MIYYDKARLDGLAKRHETILELTDYFVNRDDFLEYRKTEFEPRPKKFGPADKDTQRPIIVIINMKTNYFLLVVVTCTFQRTPFENLYNALQRQNETFFPRPVEF
jgi:hypothetical protein